MAGRQASTDVLAYIWPEDNENRQSGILDKAGMPIAHGLEARATWHGRLAHQL
jgi:hypothetical protein